MDQWKNSFFWTPKKLFLGNDVSQPFKPPAPREEPFRGILPFHKVFEKLFSSPQRQTIMVVFLEDAYTNQGETLYFLRDESALRRRKKASKAQQISTPMGIEFQINFWTGIKF